MIRLALERPVSTTILVLTLVTLGVVSLLRLPVSLLPEVDRPVVEVTLTDPGRSREEMLHGLTIPLERRLSSVAGLTSIRSETAAGRSRIVLESEWQTDSDRLQIEVARRAQEGGEFRPASTTVTMSDPADMPILEVAVTGGTGAARTEFVEGVLVPEVARVRGAGRIEAIGFAPLHVEIALSPADLAARGLTARDVVRRLERTGIVQAAGTVRRGASALPVILIERIESLEELATLTIQGPGGAVPLGEVARIAVRELRIGGRFRLNGEDGVLLRVHRGPGANVVSLASGVREVLDRIRPRMPSGLELVLLGDRSREVAGAVRDLAWAALAGLLLGTLVLRWILGHWRITLALSAVVPASILTAMIAFYVFGVSLDVVSIAGLALAAGMLIDNSIVVGESIETARDRWPNADPALEGARRVVRPVLVSTLTTVMVFLPFMFLRGLARAFFGQQAFAVIVSIAASLLFSLILTPILCRRASPAGGARIGTESYVRALGRSLERPVALAIVFALILVLAVILPLLLGRELFPAGASREIVVDATMPGDLTDEEAERRIEELRARVRAASGDRVQRIHSWVAPASGESARSGAVVVEFARPSDSRRVLDAVAAAASVAGVETRTRAGSSALVASLGFTRSLEVVASAPDVDRAEALARRAELALRQAGIELDPAASSQSAPALAIEWERGWLARSGASVEDLESQLAAAIATQFAGRVDLEGVRAPIRIAGIEGEKAELVPLRISEDAAPVPLEAVGSMVPAEPQRPLEREALQASVRMEVAEPATDPFEVAAAVEALPLAAGEELSVGGSALELRRSFRDLGFALILSLVLVFLTLAAAYESFTLPPLIMLTVPVAAAGAFVALGITGQTLNLLSLIGVVVLGGIVVNNAIVLVDAAESLIPNLSPREAALAAAKERYRPILMTTLTTLCGMLPLALVGGEGAELRRALATTILGGLTASMLASLVMVPALYPLARRWSRRRS